MGWVLLVAVVVGVLFIVACDLRAFWDRDIRFPDWDEWC